MSVGQKLLPDISIAAVIKRLAEQVLATANQPLLRVAGATGEAPAATAPHKAAHPDYELLFMDAGRCRVILSQRTMYLQQHELLLLPQQYRRQVRLLADGYCRLLRLSAEHRTLSAHVIYLNDNGDGELGSLKLRLNATTKALVSMIIQEAVHNAPYAEPIQRGALTALTSYLLRYCTTDEATAAIWQDDVVYQAIDYIEAQYTDSKLMVVDLADHVGLSKQQFGARFSKAIGYPPYHYVILVRMENACRLLRDTAASVEAVSAAVGFNDPDHFSTTFRAIVGETPSTYRKLVQTQMQPGLPFS